MPAVPGTCVAIEGLGALIRGPSGSGKSDLALRLIDTGARLVSDDHTQLELHGDGLVASAPDAIGDLIEVRGLGVLHIPRQERVALIAVIDLVAPETIERFPDDRTCMILDVPLPVFSVAAWEASAAAKVRLATGIAAGRIRRAT